MEWFKLALTNAFVMNARARRSEYWFFFLFNVIIGFVLGFTDGLLGTYNDHYNIGLLSGIANLVLLIPSFTVCVRRLHDTNHSGFFMLWLLLPIIGFFVVLLQLVKDSAPEENKYGRCPKS